MLPSLPALRAFDVAARLGSFRAAADQLSVSATAVSHHVRKLEEQLGAELFHRVGRRVILSESGKRLAAATSQAFELLEETVSSFRRSTRNVVRVAAGPIFTARWLMPRISEFWEQHPGIELEVVPHYRPHSVGSADADIVVRWGRLTDVPPGSIRLQELQPVAVASPAFVERFGPFGAPSDLLDVPILHQRDHWGWKDWFTAMGVPVPEHLRGAVFEDANVILRGAIEGHSAVLGWLPLVEQDLREGWIQRVFNEDIAATHGYFIEGEDHDVRRRSPVRIVRNWFGAANE